MPEKEFNDAVGAAADSIISRLEDLSIPVNIAIPALLSIAAFSIVKLVEGAGKEIPTEIDNALDFLKKRIDVALEHFNCKQEHKVVHLPRR